MSGDLVTLRILTAFKSAQDRDLLRQAVAATAIPVDMVEVDNTATAYGALRASDIDIMLLDTAMAAQDGTALLVAARAARKPPFVLLVQDDPSAPADGMLAPDGIIARPTKLEQAMDLLGRATRARMASRVLVVDDSATMRSIVRKILSGSRFPLEVVEAHEGIQALNLIASGKFQYVFLDYNMPGLNGIETLSEIKRQYPWLEVVIMTATQDDAVAERARAAGAAAFLKKPFYPSDVDALLLHGICGPRARR